MPRVREAPISPGCCPLGLGSVLICGHLTGAPARGRGRWTTAARDHLLQPLPGSAPPAPAACPAHTYGHNCSQACSCFNGASWDPAHGQRRCGPGWMGPTCLQGKPCPGVWGRATRLLLPAPCRATRRRARGAHTAHWERRAGKAGTVPPPWGAGAGEEGLGPHPAALSPGGWAAGPGALEQVVLEAALGPCPLGRACRSSGLTLRGFRPRPGRRGCCRSLLSPSPACPVGLYGKDCQHSCLCRNRGTCDPVSGHCTCPEGWAGLACEEGERRAGGRRRKEGPWGLEPRASAPACLGAAPAPVAAWSWGSGSWGVACSVTSPLGTPPSQGHGIRGSGCGKQGRAGVSWAPGAGPSPVPSPAPASAECPPGFSGAGCQHVCGCLHGGLCDRHTGHCRCPAGWTGDECQSREWGGLGPLRCGLGSRQGVEASPGWATDR